MRAMEILAEAASRQISLSSSVDYQIRLLALLLICLIHVLTHGGDARHSTHCWVLVQIFVVGDGIKLNEIIKASNHIFHHSTT